MPQLGIGDVAQRFRRVLRHDVLADQHRPHAAASDRLVRHRLHQFDAARDGRDAHALDGKHPGDRTADAHAGPRHQRGLSLQLQIHRLALS